MKLEITNMWDLKITSEYWDLTILSFIKHKNEFGMCVLNFGIILKKD